jgi:hypothetical protein
MLNGERPDHNGQMSLEMMARVDSLLAACSGIREDSEGRRGG